MANVQEIDALLPQTQCGECGYPGCLPYAQALAQGVTTIDRCPPGGVSTLKNLAQLLEVDATPYVEFVATHTRQPATAIIREAECIGCTKCIQACPVDAIVGSAKLMHTILTQECTGCGLCVAPCPVDCIELQSLPEPVYDKQLARQRHQAKTIRQLKAAQAQEQQYREKRQLAAQSDDKQQDAVAKQAFILEAMARAQAKKNGC